jgi:hypothetical protein
MTFLTLNKAYICPKHLLSSYQQRNSFRAIENVVVIFGILKCRQNISVPVGVKFFTVLRFHAVYDSIRSLSLRLFCLYYARTDGYMHMAQLGCALFQIFCCTLTPRSTVLLHKLKVVPRLLTKYPALHRTRRFINAFTKARQCFSMLNEHESKPRHSSIFL